jgi:hypothetical protein
MSSRPVAFEGTVTIKDPDDDDELLSGLARAIIEAARAAAENISTDDEVLFDVSRIQVTVRGNPGPTSYTAVITASGSGGG